MDYAHAEQAVSDELGDAILTLLTPAGLQTVLGRAKTGDGQYDPWLACAEACAILGRRARATGTVTRWQADGATVQRTAADWASVEAEYRALAGGGDVDFAFLVVP